ncbi:hypothetical protein [Raineya orbicola]|jgi:hypothetical protein|uniref:Uncharacterized protein n=1 Tax=Raineya orbicola TaxID=2016530 RepID=A0A2N3IAR8_9BACT|nr:hypothetical protein [Raineya orbicola]PKQ67442.1 hypothetical protein Rain11_1995 [Raineya orbicola]
MKVFSKIALLVVILFVSGAFILKRNCHSCNDDLQRIISQIKQKAKLKKALLVQEQYFQPDEGNNERKVVWQGGFSYCDGKCFAVVTVTANCFLGYCWGFQATSSGDKDCECGTFCPCTVE